MEIRRQDRALTSLDEIVAILARCRIMRLGFADEEGPYVVPVNFGYAVRDGRITVYAHGANEGRKVTAIKGRRHCCVEVDMLDGMYDAGTGACGLSSYYRSVIGFGTGRIVDDPSEAREAMMLLVGRQRPDMVATVPSPLPDQVSIIAVDLDQVTGKCRPLDAGGQPVE